MPAFLGELVRSSRGSRAAVLTVVVALTAGMFVGASPAAAGGAACHNAPLREGSDPVVEMKIMCFSPTVVRVDPGTTVRFVNRDEMTHLVTGVAYQWGNPEPLPGGATLDVAFDQAGTYPYSCMLHYGMTGVIVVGDGRFTGGPGPVVKSSSSSSSSSSSVSAPAAAVVAQTSVEPRSSGRSPWFYAGAGALGGLALAAAGFGLASARRADRS